MERHAGHVTLLTLSGKFNSFVTVWLVVHYSDKIKLTYYKIHAFLWRPLNVIYEPKTLTTVVFHSKLSHKNIFLRINKDTFLHAVCWSEIVCSVCGFVQQDSRCLRVWLHWLRQIALSGGQVVSRQQWDSNPGPSAYLLLLRWKD